MASTNQDTNPSISHPVDVQGFLAVDSRPVASFKGSKSVAEANSLENYESEYMSYVKFSLPEPTKNISDKDKSVLQLLDEVEIKHTKPPIPAPPVLVGERRQYPFSSPPERDCSSIQQNRKHKKIKLVPRIETASRSDGDANASEHVLRPLHPEKDVTSCTSEAEEQVGLCRKTSFKSKGSVSKHVLKPLDLTKRVSPDSCGGDGQVKPSDSTESLSNTKETAADREEDKNKKLKIISAYILEVRALCWLVK